MKKVKLLLSLLLIFALCFTVLLTSCDESKNDGKDDDKSKKEDPVKPSGSLTDGSSTSPSQSNSSSDSSSQSGSASATDNTQSPLSSSWPEAEIKSILGADIPKYSGAGEYILNDISIGSQKMANLTVFGADSSAESTYLQVLAGDGYTMEDNGVYIKKFADGSSIEINAYYGSTMHPTNFTSGYALFIMASFNKSAGAYTTWQSLDLSFFSEISLPEFTGASSFDLDDICKDTVEAETAAVKTAIDILAKYESMLGEDEKAELEALRAQLPYIEQIKAYALTVYGTTEEAVYSYDDALSSAGFRNGEKDTDSFRYTVEYGQISDDGRVTFTLTKTPMELIRLEENGNSSSNGSEDVADILDFDDLPENVRFTFKSIVSGYEYMNATVTKIGSDWLLDQNSALTFLKHTDNGWKQYFYSDGWLAVNEEETLEYIDDNTYISSMDVLFDNSTSGFIKSGKETVAGVECDKYVLSEEGLEEVVCLSPEGFAFYRSSDINYSGIAMSTSHTIALWDTNVTSFGMEIPQ